MEINTVNTVNDISIVGNYTQSTVAKIAETHHSQIEVAKEHGITNANNESDKEHRDSDKQELNSDQAHKVSAEMNKFMRMLNSDIRFVVHEQTNTRMVQVVDNKDNTVLKEFPSHELLDIKAKIREYVGILLDRHA